MSLGWSISLIIFFFALGWYAGHTKLKTTIEKDIQQGEDTVKKWWITFKTKF